MAGRCLTPQPEMFCLVFEQPFKFLTLKIYLRYRFCLHQSGGWLAHQVILGDDFQRRPLPICIEYGGFPRGSANT